MHTHLTVATKLWVLDNEKLKKQNEYLKVKVGGKECVKYINYDKQKEKVEP